jgi:hypothetical protein
VVPNDFDNVAVVVDWLDACRSRNLEMLLDLYAGDASMECACEGIVARGRSELAAYWAPKLSGFRPGTFGLEQITPRPEGVTLDYSDFEGKAVRVVFVFDGQGKISHSHCGPLQP